MNELEALRERIRALKSERLEIIAQPLSRATVQRLTERVVDEAHRQGKRALGIAIARAAAGQALAPLSVRASGAIDGATGTAKLSMDLSPLLVTLLGQDRVKELLLQACDDLPEGLDPPARILRLAKIDADLEALERDEEDRIVELENQGVSIMRRPDARPELIIAT